MYDGIMYARTLLPEFERTQVMNMRGLVCPMASTIVMALVFPLVAAGADSRRESVCLNGDLWRIVAGNKLPAEPPGPGLPSADWQPTRVPGCFRERLGYEFTDTQPDPAVLGSAGAYNSNLPWHRNEAWYRLDFYVPADWNDGRRIVLAFDGVNYRCKVLVNGKPVGEHEGAHAAFEIDCSDGQPVRFGQMNTLHVWVKGIRPFTFYGDRESHFAGIWGNVFLRSYPAVFIENVQVVTSVRQKTLTARIIARNSTTQPQRVTLRAAVHLGGGQPAEQQVLSIDGREVELAAGPVRGNRARAGVEGAEAVGLRPLRRAGALHAADHAARRGRRNRRGDEPIRLPRVLG